MIDFIDIIGMIGAFGIMSQAGIDQAHAVTGLAEAADRHASDLLIAIMTLVHYNYFANRAEMKWKKSKTTPRP
ncbi:MAG TPA: MotA/TolQ/ExbB proton channel family protein [Candidatus Limnocylindria bacterium]|nr:MotA/TolQ/ExbB proton channel family protein [Candidatus Limnocylindria bacterium]